MTDALTMRPLFKTAIVAGGYVAAFLIACAAVAVRIAAMSGQGHGDDGMRAFGDSIAFVSVFGVAAVPATGAALFFLWPIPWFWRVLSVVVLTIAATGLAAIVIFTVGRTAYYPALGIWEGIAILRMLTSPFFAGLFCLCALLAPRRPFRSALLVATAMEATTAAYGFAWFLRAIFS